MKVLLMKRWHGKIPKILMKLQEDFNETPMRLQRDFGLKSPTLNIQITVTQASNQVSRLLKKVLKTTDKKSFSSDDLNSIEVPLFIMSVI